MRLATLGAATALVLAASFSAMAQNTPAPEGARVYFINLQDGDHVQSPFLVQFGLSGMGIAPFGLTGPGTENTGHHHLIIDADPPQPGVPIPADMNHVHYGRGQTEAMVTLPPGEHTLQLVLGDALHVPHDPPVMSERITITVDP